MPLSPSQPKEAKEAKTRILSMRRKGVGPFQLILSLDSILTAKPNRLDYTRSDFQLTFSG